MGVYDPQGIIIAFLIITQSIRLVEEWLRFPNQGARFKISLFGSLALPIGSFRNHLRAYDWLPNLGHAERTKEES
jgi:hypothetical protein